MHCFLILPTDTHCLYLIYKTAIHREQRPLGLQSSLKQTNPHTHCLLATIWLQSCSHQQGFCFLSQRNLFEDGGLLEGVTIQLTEGRTSLQASFLT